MSESTPALPRLVAIEQNADGWIKKYTLTYEQPDGTRYRYEAASRKSLDAFRRGLAQNAAGERTCPDAVCIIPITDRGTLLMIREFRYALNARCVAFPAGLVEPGEQLADCIDRELREETGFALRDVPNAVRALPQSGFSSTGMSDEAVQTVFAQVERAGAAHPEQNELIEPFELPTDGIRRFLDGNAMPLGTRTQLVLELLAQHYPQRSR